MENEIYERDYRRTPEEIEEMMKSEEDTVRIIPKDTFKAFEEAIARLPRYILPEGRAAYEELLPRLDAYAKTWHGTIRGIVDYEKWEAHISLELPHFQAFTSEGFALLADLAAKTSIVIFRPGKNGRIRLNIWFDYFRSQEKLDLPSELIDESPAQENGDTE